ncbi:MAG: FAD-dependent oxidoreductase [Thermodesulfovibrionales bacterium]|nr:FAD-dependent oxidoreductase [Thermodesulfovibrionales bacterium]
MSAKEALVEKKSFYERVYEIKEKRPYPPCRAACPVHTDIQAYVGLIAKGKYNEAFDVITAPNPLATTCSMICHHPCEQACRRCAIDDPLAIRHLKRFAIEQSREYRKSKRKFIEKTKGKSIGIIGSGPSGLTAANDLASAGYYVTIYEKLPVLGGMLASAIPPYRLPREMLKEDIEDIISKGIEVKTSCEIGKDITINEIISKHDAVLIAVGLSESRSLNIPGIEGPGVLLAIPFLQDVAFDRKPTLGNKVLVIGGGNVAVDVARSARRLGIKDISMVCLESAEEMPAWKWEIDECLEENIKIHNRWGPKAIRRSNGKIEGLEVVKVKSVFDEMGRFAPTFYDEQTSFIDADTIIIAIGQMSNMSLLKDSPIKLDQRGRIEWDPDTQMTNVKGVFVSGEVVTGPGSAVAAVANGHRAALAIDLYLQGKTIKGYLPPQEKEKIPPLPVCVIEKITSVPRRPIKHLAPEVRCDAFIHYEINYDEEEALKEAARCRGCGGGAVVNINRCMGCLTCQRICPYGAPFVHSYSEIRLEYCQACGLCAPECPGRAISMLSYDINEIKEIIEDLQNVISSKVDSPKILALLCTHHIGVSGIELPEEIYKVPIHCISRIDSLDILKAFECKFDGVMVIHCQEGSCKYRNIKKRVVSRLQNVKRLLTTLGIDSDRLTMIPMLSTDGGSIYKECSDFISKISSK